MRNNDLITNRNRMIYEEYARLWGLGLREELIWPQLTNAFHLQANTIYRIVLNQSKVIKTTPAPDTENE